MTPFDFNKKFIASGLLSVQEFIDKGLDEEGEAMSSPVTTSTQFSTNQKPENAMKKDEVEDEEK